MKRSEPPVSFVWLARGEVKKALSAEGVRVMMNDDQTKVIGDRGLQHVGTHIGLSRPVPGASLKPTMHSLA